jgi:ubiquitin C-terminal hydrolase
MRMLHEFFDVLDKDGRDANVLSSTRTLYDALGSNSGNQEDVHECLMGIVERLSNGHRKRTDALAKTRNKLLGSIDSIMRSVVEYMDVQWKPKTDLEALLTGQFAHMTVCTSCERLRVSADDFSCLSVSGQNVAQGIRDYMGIETFEAIDCEWCKRKTPSKRVTRMHRCPRILPVLVHGSGPKEVPEIIDVKPYTSQILDDRKTIEYELRSAACHFGTLKYGGHYVALCKDARTDQWNVYNDTVQTDASDPKVRAMIASKAYLIIYEQR